MDAPGNCQLPDHCCFPAQVQVAPLPEVVDVEMAAILSINTSICLPCTKQEKLSFSQLVIGEVSMKGWSCVSTDATLPQR